MTYIISTNMDTYILVCIFAEHNENVKTLDFMLAENYTKRHNFFHTNIHKRMRKIYTEFPCPIGRRASDILKSFFTEEI